MVVEGKNPEIYRNPRSNGTGGDPNGPVEAENGTILAQARRLQRAEAELKRMKPTEEASSRQASESWADLTKLGEQGSSVESTKEMEQR